MLRNTVWNIFFGVLHPEEVDLPQVLQHLGRSRQAVLQPCATEAREHPEDSRNILQFSKHQLGFFPLRREKVEKHKKGRYTHAALAPGLAGHLWCDGSQEGLALS